MEGGETKEETRADGETREETREDGEIREETMEEIKDGVDREATKASNLPVDGLSVRKRHSASRKQEKSISAKWFQLLLRK